MVDAKRARYFVKGALQWFHSLEGDRPEVLKTQAGSSILRDLSYAMESLGGPFVGKHPETAGAVLDALYEGETDKGTAADLELGWPKDEHMLTLVQQLFGAVMPSAMFYTSWPAEYYDMIHVGTVLDKRMTPKAIKFVIDAINEKLDREAEVEKAKP
jgi:hypothetical protein